MRALVKAFLLVLLGWTAAPVLAAEAAPADLTPPHVESPHEGDAARVVPIGSYTLATFWMPQHCKQNVRGIVPIDCERPEVRSMGLALHGLWPDGVGKDWPQWCKPADVLPMATLGRFYPATPSTQQLQHEWAKHGTCMAGYTPDRYFDQAGKLYRAIHVPDLRAMSYGHPTVDSVKRAIADANPGLKPDMIKLSLDRQGWLQEVWFCLDTKFARMACAEPQREPGDAPVLIWRGGRARSSYNDRGYARRANYRYGDRGGYGGYRPRPYY